MTYQTPRAVLNAYMDGSKQLDPDLLATCFHANAVMSGDLDGQLLVGGPAPFFDDIAKMAESGVDHSGFSAEITDLAVTGRIASALVRSKGFGGRFGFEDRFHLIEDAGGWLIISKCFTTV